MRGNQFRLLWGAAIVLAAAGAYSGRLLLISPPKGSASVSASPSAPTSSGPSRRTPVAFSASRKSDRLWTHSIPALDGMNDGNWKECLASLRPETLVPGTGSWSSWQSALYRAGRHGGRTAVEELLAKDRAGGDGLAQSSEVFAGWAAAEPEAAWEWLAASSDARLRSVFLPRFSSGVPEVPDELALEQFTNLPIEQKREKAVQAIQDLLETGGYDAAETLLDREASAAAGDPVAEGILQTLFDTVAKHREQAMKSGGSVEETTNWLASYSDRSFVRKEHYSIAAAELGAREGPESAAAWLASLASEDAAEPVKSALADNIQQWAVRDPAAAGAWVKTLEDHPSYEVMVSHLSEGLRNPGPKTINATP